MKALVTGGAGFIGSHLTDALIARGDEVLVFDDLTTGRRENLSSAIAGGARILEGSVADAETVNAAFSSFEPDAVFHLAAQIDVRRSVREPGFDSSVNIGGTINVLESARAHGDPKIVFSSTGGAIYGEVEESLLPIGEEVSPQPLAPYGQSKYSAEGYMRLARSLHGQRTTVLRYANVYGPRQDPLGEGGVVAIFCNQLLTGGSPTVFGDGKQTRDFVYVGDVVAANLLAIDAEAAGPINIGTGSETSVLDLVDALQLRTESPFSPVFEAARIGEIERSSLDASRARELLGWEPTTTLTAGLSHVLAGADR
jgi:UDP-glucose 4-epimerase